MDFEARLKIVWDDLVRYARALAGSRQNGDDILQEALLRAWEGYASLKDREAFKPWLIAIIRRTHLSSVRIGWVKRMIGLEAALEVPAPESLAFDDRELVRAALRRTPLPQREALILFEILNYSTAEIAVIQKVTLSAVKTRLARGRERLRREMEKLCPESIPAVATRTTPPAPFPRGEEHAG